MDNSINQHPRVYEHKNFSFQFVIISFTYSRHSFLITADDNFLILLFPIPHSLNFRFQKWRSLQRVPFFFPFPALPPPPTQQLKAFALA